MYICEAFMSTYICTYNIHIHNIYTIYVIYVVCIIGCGHKCFHNMHVSLNNRHREMRPARCDRLLRPAPGRRLSSSNAQEERVGEKGGGGGGGGTPIWRRVTSACASSERCAERAPPMRSRRAAWWRRARRVLRLKLGRLRPLLLLVAGGPARGARLASHQKLARLQKAGSWGTSRTRELCCDSAPPSTAPETLRQPGEGGRHGARPGDASMNLSTDAPVGAVSGRIRS